MPCGCGASNCDNLSQSTILTQKPVLSQNVNLTRYTTLKFPPPIPSQLVFIPKRPPQVFIHLPMFALAGER